MNPEYTGAGNMRAATVNLTIAGRKVRLQFNAPTGPTAPVDLLPLFQSLADTFIGIAVENAQAEGGAISCRKGCGACCRQLVPISEIEVEAIRRLVGTLPEPRRQEVIDRFTRARERLSEAGLLEVLRAPEQVTREEVRSLGDEYFRQGIPCPFLDGESCSIHADRPLVCREYLVTSPAANCAQPTAETVQCVAMPVKMSRAIRHLDDGNPDASATWIPMILALEWPQTDRNGATAPPGTVSIAKLFEQLTGKEVPEPDV